MKRLTLFCAWDLYINHTGGDGICIITPFFTLELGFLKCFYRYVVEEKFSFSFVKFWQYIEEGMLIPTVPVINVIFRTIAYRQLYEA